MGWVETFRVWLVVVSVIGSLSRGCSVTCRALVLIQVWYYYEL